jgi:hypothetical protein
LLRSHGIATVPIGGGRAWSLIKAPVPMTRLITVSDAHPDNSVIGVCLGGRAFLVSIANATSAQWKNTTLACMQVAIDPNDADITLVYNPNL